MSVRFCRSVPERTELTYGVKYDYPFEANSQLFLVFAVWENGTETYIHFQNEYELKKHIVEIDSSEAVELQKILFRDTKGMDYTAEELGDKYYQVAAMIYNKILEIVNGRANED